MRRREVITLLAGAAAAWPFGARAEVAPKRPLIAWLSGGTAQFSAGFVDNFLRGGTLVTSKAATSTCSIVSPTVMATGCRR
jgi:hypothetical protein